MRGKHISLPALGILGIASLISGCGSSAALERFPNTIELGVEKSCHDDSGSESTLCVTLTSEGSRLIEATGLAPSTEFNIRGSKGDAMDGTVSADGTLLLDVGGQLVEDDFNIEVVVVSGEPIAVTVVVGE